MAKALKNRASKKAYFSTRQLTFVTFESPFSQNLRARWVQLAASNLFHAWIFKPHESLAVSVRFYFFLNSQGAIGSTSVQSPTIFCLACFSKCAYSSLSEYLIKCQTKPFFTTSLFTQISFT